MTLPQFSEAELKKSVEEHQRAADERRRIDALPKQWVWCEQGGLMEDPLFHWERMFKTHLTDLGEACRYHAKEDAKFAENYRENGKYHCFWGWTLRFERDVFKNGHA